MRTFSVKTPLRQRLLLTGLLLLSASAPALAGKPSGGTMPPPTPNLPVTYKMVSLGALGESSIANAIADNGTVVGGYTAAGLNFAFVALPGGPMEDLNDVAADFLWVDADAPGLDSETVRLGWRLTSGRGVNEAGMIAGMCVPAAQTDSSIIRSYRFDPVHLTVTLLPTNGADWSRTGWRGHINERGDVAYTDQTAGRVLVFTGPYEGGDQLLYPVDAAFVSTIGDGGQLAGNFYNSLGNSGSGYVFAPGAGLLTAPFVGFHSLHMSPDAGYVVCGKNLTAKGKTTTYGYRYMMGSAAPVSITPSGGSVKAVNSSGDACGNCVTASGSQAPFLYLNGGGLTYGLVDLARQSGLPANWVSLDAITSREPTTGFPWMCGHSPDATGANRAVLVYPVPN